MRKFPNFVEVHYTVSTPAEQEITFTLSTNDIPVFRIIMWIGYFDALMAEISPDNESWDELLDNHLALTGWNTEPYQLKDLLKAFRQFSQIDTSLMEPECGLIRENLVRIIGTAIEDNGQILISSF